MSILNRASLEQSPLADLHVIASELGLDSYRRLRKAELIDAILARQGGDEEVEQAPADDEVALAVEDQPPPGDEDAEEEDRPPRARRGRRGGRGRRRNGAARDDDADGGVEEPDGPELEGPEAIEDELEPLVGGEAAEESVEGVVEVLPNGSAFVRVDPPEPSDDDVYISAAQVRRCELVNGDRVRGPRRRPRRSERFASLIRVEEINGRPAEELSAGIRFDDLPAAFPSERFRFGSEDPTIKAIEWLAPFGRGSRVTLIGGARGGKTEALRRLAAELSGDDGTQLMLVLVGARPEEIAEWQSGSITPAVALGLGAPADGQALALEATVEQGRRLAARGADVVILIDTLDAVEPVVARRVLGAARNIVDGGSLTVVGTASAALGGETTVVGFDAQLTAAGRFPAVDLRQSGTLRPELLVGQEAADAIARAKAEAFDR